MKLANDSLLMSFWSLFLKFYTTIVRITRSSDGNISLVSTNVSETDKPTNFVDLPCTDLPNSSMDAQLLLLKR